MTGKQRTIALGVALCALVIWFFCGRSAAVELVYPVENGVNWFTRRVMSPFRILRSHVSVIGENERLRREVEALRLTCVDAERVVEDNARLRALLGLDAPNGQPSFSTNRWITADVLSRGAASGVPGVIRIGRGSLAGVKEGAVVAVPDGLVGRVDSVTPHTATVTLLTEPSMRVACEIETGDSSDPPLLGILSGGGIRPVAEAGASILYIVHPFRIRNLRRQTNPPPHAKIITSGLGGVYPRGLVVGFLGRMREDETRQLERECDVVPAVDFPNLDYVFIRRED